MGFNKMYDNAKILLLCYILYIYMSRYYSNCPTEWFIDSVSIPHRPMGKTTTNTLQTLSHKDLKVISCQRI